MTSAKYPICIEVSGKYGMFADPSSGSEAISFEIPPPTACIGMIESIFRSPYSEIEIEIVAVGVCSSPKWTPMTFNSCTLAGQKRNRDHYKNLQVHEAVLINPHYQILALFKNKPKYSTPYNDAHASQERFFKRLNRGFGTVEQKSGEIRVNPRKN